MDKLQRTNKTELVVLNIETEEEVFYTKDYLVHDAVFNNENSKILLDVYNKKPFSIDLKTLEIVELPKKEIRIYQGVFNPSENTFYFPSITKNKCLYSFSFNTGKTNEVILKITGKIKKIMFLRKKNTYIVFSTNDIIYCLSSNLKVINWELDLTKLEDKPRYTSPEILSSETDDLIYISASATVNNKWGVDYCINQKDGEIVNYLAGKKGEGRIKEHYFNNDAFLYTGNVVDMLTGEIRKPEEIRSIASVLCN